MAKAKSAATAVAEKPIHPNDVDYVGEDKAHLYESNAPIAPAEVKDESSRIFSDEQEATAGGNIQMFPISRLFRKDNVRTPATEKIDQMVASLKRHGFKKNHPIVVSLKGKPIDKSGHDGLVLCGNRRVLGVEFLYANDPDSFARIFPDGMIPAIIHEDLTEEQEALIRNDHGTDEDRVPLDEWGEFLAVKQLVRAGYATERGIAEKMGKYVTNAKTGAKEPARSWAQPRVNLARLPQFVQDEMQKYCEQRSDGGAVVGSLSRIRWSDVMRLTKPFNKEFLAYPNGDGPEFKKVWDDIIGRTDESDDPNKPVNVTAANAIDLAKAVSSRNLREALTCLVKKGRPGFADIDAALVKAETAEAVLTDIADYMGAKEFQALVDKATVAGNAKRAKESQPAA